MTSSKTSENALAHFDYRKIEDHVRITLRTIYNSFSLFWLKDSVALTFSCMNFFPFLCSLFFFCSSIFLLL